MEAQILDPLSCPRWEETISTHPGVSFFHGTAWASVLSKTYNHRPFYLLYQRARQPMALLPMMEVDSILTGRRGVSLPFTDYCAPLLFERNATVEIANDLHELGQRRAWRSFELRGSDASPAEVVPSTRFYGHSLDLSQGEETLFSGFASAVRRAIRKAERSDLVAHVAHNREAVSEFYRLHMQTRRHHGLPPQPKSFFTHIWEEVIRHKMGFVSLVALRAKTIAASMFFVLSGNAVYKFGASDKAYQSLRPSNLAMWRGIQFLCGQRAKSLHFGRTSLQHEGLRRFKLAWGTKEEVLSYFRFGMHPAGWTVSRDKAAGFHNILFSRLPLFLNRLAGTMIYPHLD